MGGIIQTAIALETKLKALLPSIDTQWENTDYTPEANKPYQFAAILWASPANLEYGARYQEQGVFHVSLRYPRKVGAGAARERAQALREHFPRALNLVQSPITVLVLRTPIIYPAFQDQDRFVIPIGVPFIVNN